MTEENKRRFWQLNHEGDAAWQRGDMEEWERLLPLVQAAFHKAGGFDGLGIQIYLPPQKDDSDETEEWKGGEE
jgi:hypothetical protein